MWNFARIIGKKYRTRIKFYDGSLSLEFRLTHFCTQLVIVTSVFKLSCSTLIYGLQYAFRLWNSIWMKYDLIILGCKYKSVIRVLVFNVTRVVNIPCLRIARIYTEYTAKTTISFDRAIIPSGLSLKQHILALPTVQVFSNFFKGYSKVWSILPCV